MLPAFAGQGLVRWAVCGPGPAVLRAAGRAVGIFDSAGHMHFHVGVLDTSAGACDSGRLGSLGRSCSDHCVGVQGSVADACNGGHHSSYCSVGLSILAVVCSNQRNGYTLGGGTCHSTFGHGMAVLCVLQ